MKKLYFIALSAVALSASAAPVTPEQALARLNSGGSSRHAAPALSAPRLIAQQSYPELYIFAGQGGFMILPADDRVSPLLGYADSGTPDLSNPDLAYWLGTYNDEIQALATLECPLPDPSYMMRSSRPPVAPLIATRWNQEAPYNDLCPTLDDTRCPTGCVATAMAQVMKFHEWPVTGTGSHSYTWQGQTLSFDYASTTFDWANMTDTYDSKSTDAEKTAVATLMYACGVGVDMGYHASESGAVSRDMGTALLNYFGYDRGMSMLNRDFYALDEWEEIIYAELAAGRPVLYGGQGSAGGHQFVCDGYSADGYFHFNWGWGGLSDGYFLLTALDPAALGVGGGAGGFNYNQNILIGVQKPTTDNAEAYVFYCDGFGASVTSTSPGTDFNVGNGFYNYSYFAPPAGTRLGIKIDPADGSDPIYMSNEFEPINPNYGLSKITTHFPSDIKEGTYTVTPVYKIPGHDWEFMHSPLSAKSSFTATVSGSTITLSTPNAANITVTDLKPETDLYWGETCKISFTVQNSGGTEYYDGLIPVLLSSDGQTLVARGSTYPVDVMAGDSEQAEYIGMFSASSTPEGGTYLLAIVNPEGRLVCTPVEVQLHAKPATTTIKVTALTLLSSTPLDGQSEAHFRVDVECTEGYFADDVLVFVFRDTGGTDVASGRTSTMYISAGQSAQAEANINVSHLDTGRYMAAAFHGSDQLSEPVYFTINTALSLDEIDTDTSTTGKAYDLMGRPLAGKPRGFYILNGKIHF